MNVRMKVWVISHPWRLQNVHQIPQYLVCSVGELSGGRLVAGLRSHSSQSLLKAHLLTCHLHLLLLPQCDLLTGSVIVIAGKAMLYNPPTNKLLTVQENQPASQLYNKSHNICPGILIYSLRSCVCLSLSACVRVCVCVRVCMHACVHACTCACACVLVFRLSWCFYYELSFSFCSFHSHSFFFQSFLWFLIDKWWIFMVSKAVTMVYRSISLISLFCVGISKNSFTL